MCCRDTEHIKCSNSTAAQVSGESAVIVDADDAQRGDSSTDDAPSAAWRSAEDTEPDLMYLLGR